MKPAERAHAPEETRKRLVEAGLRLFGASGLGGVSTRSLAEAASVNLAAIPYHFGGKEGVYLAVAQHICDTNGRALREASERFGRGAETLGPREAASQAGKLVSEGMRVLLAVADGPARAGFMLREQLDPTAAFDLLYSQFIGPFHAVLSLLVARATGHSPEAPVTIVRAHALFGQGLAFGVARATLARRLSEGGRRGRRPEPPTPEAIAAIVEKQTIAALLGTVV